MKYSEEQLQVINTEGCNILVSAAAGSGKTAVLVERIIRKITDATNPVDVDSLLVMTFTRAAAYEMKERIEKAINNRLLEEVEAGKSIDLIEHLKRQASLVRIAEITTIDSFCKDIIQNNFTKIGLDPSFRVANEAELKLLRSDVMQEVLESEYQEASEEFLDFLQNFSVKTNDKDVEDAIEKLYDFSQSKPDPVSYLKDCVRYYNFDSAKELFDSVLIKDYLSSIRQQIVDFAEESIADIKICEKPAGPYKYGDILEMDAQMLNKVALVEDYEQLRLFVDGLAFERMPSISKKDAVNEDLKELVKSRRNDRKGEIKDIFNKTLSKKEEDVFADVTECRNIVNELSRLTMRFAQTFSEKKRELSILDFSDLEHLALNILYESDMKTPSDVAIAYRDKFNEIMVDEYQDSNEVQEALINAICRKNNVFTVGDVKQSIYGFRLTKPELFMNRMNSYTKINGDVPGDVASDSVRIDLHNNFRSAKAVLDSANYVFDKIMHKEVGGIDYDEDARLVHGRLSEDSADSMSELLLITPVDGANDREIEALTVANKINSLVGNYTLIDKETGNERMLEYRDIAILLRSRSGWEDVFSKILSMQDIPNHAESATGFFDSFEIRTILNYLKLINNPLDDVTLAAVLRGPFGNFSDEELALIRANHKEGCFYDALRTISYKSVHSDDGMKVDIGSEEKEAGTEFCDELCKKLCDFSATLECFRDLVSYTPVHVLIENIIEKFDYESFICALKNGENRLLNVSMLLVRAKEFEKTSFKGLFGFIRYIEKLKTFEIEYGEADSISEYDNCVRIMSIHKSKGLEFPITFLCGTAKTYNTRSESAAIVLDEACGMGIDYIDSVARTKATTIVKEAIKFKQKRVNIGEELRVLYVAMTRAREKLIITGVAKDEMLLTYENARDKSVLSMSDVLGANSYLKLLLSCCGTDNLIKMSEEIESDSAFGDKSTFDNGDCRGLGNSVPMRLIRVEAEDILNGVVDITQMDTLDKKVDITQTENPDNGLGYENCGVNIKQSAVSDINANVGGCIVDINANIISEAGAKKDNTEVNITQDFVYLYQANAAVPMKLSVSAIKHMSMEEKASDDRYDLKFLNSEREEDATVPYFISGKVRQELVGALRGSAYHRFFELMPFEDADEQSDDVHEKSDDVQEQSDDVHEKSDDVHEKSDDVHEKSDDVHEQSDDVHEKSDDVHEKSNDVQEQRKNAYGLHKIEEYKSQFVSKGLISQREVDAIADDDVVRFMSTNLYNRMCNANAKGLLYKEQPFSYLINANSVDKSYPENEEIIVQGIIDAFFYEGDEIVIMDYKTDRVKTGKELVDRYDTQLKLYAEALHQITGKVVKECIIYSVELGCEVAL